MEIRLFDLIRGAERKADGYSRALQAARVRAAHQRSYFAPALFNLVPVETDLIGSMAVDSHWRLYYNEAWVATHTVEENATPAHPRGRAICCATTRRARRPRASGTTGAGTPPATAKSTTISTPRDCRCRAIRRCPASTDCRAGTTPRSTTSSCRRRRERTDTRRPAMNSSSRRTAGRARTANGDSGSCRPTMGATEECRVSTGSRPSSCGARWRGASTRRRPTTATSRSPGGAGPARRSRRRSTTWRRSVTRCAERLRDSTLGRYDRTYRRPHRRQACYGEFIMPSFYQPRPRPGFLIDTSGSMEDSQLARAVSELGGLTRQLGYGADVVVACCDAAVHDVKKVFAGAQVELYGGGGTDIGVGTARVHRAKDRADRPAGHRQRLPHAVAEGGAAVSGHHHPRRRRRAAAVGKSRRQQGDYDRGAGRRARENRREGDGDRRWRGRIARDESLEAAPADDSAGLDARPGSGSPCGNSGWACSCAARSVSARGSSSPLPTTSSPCSISRTATPRRRSFSPANASPTGRAR